MDRKAILRNALENLNSQFIREGEISIGLTRFSRYKVVNLDNDTIFNIAGSYYGIDCPEYWEGIYYDQERDLFFYVGRNRR
jgi:hypothetical protein